jgi:hypothetical protein
LDFHFGRAERYGAPLANSIPNAIPR